MASVSIFVSHSHHDDALCHRLVDALRSAGADIWYDEHNLGSGQLGPTIERELRARPIFLLVLSPAALSSAWVEDETRWAYNLYRRDHTRIILPILAEAVDEAKIWLFLQDFKRIEAAGVRPYPPEEAMRQTMRALALTPAGQVPAPTAPQPQESADDLLERGKALRAQGRADEGLPLLERATELAPQSFDTWSNLGWALYDLKRYSDALAAYERAVTISPHSAEGWSGKGATLNDLERYDEALAALEQALSIDPTYAEAWNNKGFALRGLHQLQEALAAYEQAINLDPTYANAWANKGFALWTLNLYEESLAAYEQAIGLDAKMASAWGGKAAALYRLKRYEEALVAINQSLELDPSDKNAQGWQTTMLQNRRKST